MKSQAKKAITLSGGAAILVLAVGFGGGDLLPSGTTTTATTRASSIMPESRPPLLSQDFSLSEHLGEASRRGQTLQTGEKIMSARQHAETPDRKRPRITESRVVPKLAQRAVIPDASALVIVSAVGGAELLGQAPANDSPYVADPTNPCPPPVEDSVNWPSRPEPETSSLPRTQIICQPAGPKWGVFCSRRIVP